MTPVMGLSILLGFATVLSVPSVEAQGLRPRPGTKTVKTAPAEVEPFPLTALEHAEEIEREAWWVVTSQRTEGRGSPFRVFRVAGLKRAGKVKTRPSLQFCQKLEIQELEAFVWQVQARCQKVAQDLGILRRQAPGRYRLEWKSAAFSQHFGLGASIFYAKQTCDFELTSGGRVQTMSCPGYARNRSAEEVVELKVFEFHSAGQALLKLKGEVKKDLQVIATIQTEVPWAGDIVVKEKQLPQKSVEDVPEVSHSKLKKNPTQESSREENQKSEKDDEKIHSEKEREESRQEGHQEIRTESQDSRAQESRQVPAQELGSEVPSQGEDAGEGSDVNVPAPSR